MLDNILLGRFIPGDSLIHRLDPRAKLLATVVFFIVVFQAVSFFDYALLIAFMLLVVKLTDLSITYFWKSFQPILWLILLTAVFQILFIQTGDVYAQLGILKISSDGLVQALVVSLRFLIIIGMSTVLSLTTNPLMIADAIENMLHPLNKIHFPVHEVSMILSIAMRFVPTILDETKTIMNAQRSRGVDFNEGRLLKRVKAIIPILVPLFANAIRRADELADAMESRGYRGGQGRTKYRQLHWQYKDSLVFVIIALINLVMLFI